jgi:DNA-binding SARP family transcriptional activator
VFVPRVLRPRPLSHESVRSAVPVAEAPFSVLSGPPGSYIPEALATLIARRHRWQDCAWLVAGRADGDEFFRLLAAACRRRWRPGTVRSVPSGSSWIELLPTTMLAAPGNAVLVIELDESAMHNLRAVVNGVRESAVDRGLRIVFVVESESLTGMPESGVVQVIRTHDVVEPQALPGMPLIPPPYRDRLIETAGDRLAVVHDVAQAARTWPVQLIARALDTVTEPEELVDHVTDQLLSAAGLDRHAALGIALATGHWHPALARTPLDDGVLRPWLVPLDDRWNRLSTCWLRPLRRQLEVGAPHSEGSAGSPETDGLAVSEADVEEELPAVVIPSPRRRPQRAAMEARLFGDFEVRIDGRPVEEWRGQRGPSILRFLLARRRHSCARDELIEEFWSGSDSGAARNRLQVAVSGLRRSLREVTKLNVVEHVEGHYRITSELSVEVDIDQFDAAASAGRRSELDGDVVSAFRSYERAARLYRGHFAQDAPFEQWTLLPREDFRLTYGDVLDRVSRMHVEAERFEDAIDAGRRMLELDPCHEEAHRLLMRCYLRQGRTQQASRQFEFCVRVLRTTLDSEPEPETVAVYRSIRQGSRSS